MTKYLLNCGHRKIAFLADNMEGVDYIRYTGHQRALQEYGLDIDLDNLIVIRPSKYERQGSMEENLCSRTQSSLPFMCCPIITQLPDEYLKAKRDPLSGRSLHHRI